MTKEKDRSFQPECGVPITPADTILLAHGGGGTLMHALIDRVFAGKFKENGLQSRHDAAELRLGDQRIAFTTDSFVVKPLRFPGGDIGTLAVCGTVNDLAMAGAEPVALSAGFILEEGLSTALLTGIVDSMSAVCRDVGVSLVTGDTKVVERGKGDGLYINTSGVGVIRSRTRIHPEEVRVGDVVIVSGDLGRHGIAVLSVREGLEFETAIQSDCAPLWKPVKKLLDAGIDVHCLRDLTRGGLVSALNEIADVCGHSVNLDETALSVHPAVAGACDLLGLDPLYVANEGRFVAFFAAKDAERAVAVLRSEPVSEDAAIAGTVVLRGEAPVILKTRLGTHRILDVLSGEQLPRIC